jgi:hypothetical protein
MLAGGKCLKCDNRRLWVIDKVSQPELDSSNRVWPMAVGAREGQFLTSDRIAVGSFQLIVCAECGYSEWYARDIDNLKHLPGAYMIGADADKSGPYR